MGSRGAVYWVDVDNEERRRQAGAWRQASKERLASARHLLRGGFYRDAASRAYYAAYYAATSVCVLHGDSGQFPPGWNNPTHEQLPGLILANGDLAADVRRQVRPLLRLLRVQRETADYRVGHGITEADATKVLRDAAKVAFILGMEG